jgi:hypothetical protein
MDLNEFEKEIKQDANTVNESALEFESDKQPETPGNDTGAAEPDVSTPTTPTPPASMNLAQLSGVIVGAYTKLSDTVYIKIKKDIPPAWDNETRALIVEALQPVLVQYNIPVTPLNSLLFTLVTVEFMRYTHLSNSKLKEVENENKTE